MVKMLINGMGLTWEFSQRSNEVVFMDLTITLTNGKISTKLYAKPIMALHLYIPPFLCHAPGVSTGLIFGHFYQVMTLCTYQHDINQELTNFLHHLLAWGYTLTYLLPVFLSAKHKALTHWTRLCQQTHPSTLQPPLKNPHDSAFLHLPFSRCQQKGAGQTITPFSQNW